MIGSYDYYRTFYYVAKYRNFTQAAAFLMNNQPNVTRTIKSLENRLGCRLFVRSNRGVSLTPEGERLYAHVSAAMEQLQAGEEELAQDAGLQSGVVSIGASEIALHGILLSVLRRFHRAYPGIRLRLFNHSTPQAIAALKNGVVDLAVVSTPSDSNAPLRAIPLRTFRDALVCGPALRELTERPHHLAQLRDVPFVCTGRETKTYEFYSAFFLQYGLTLSPDMEASTSDQVLSMICNDLGIGFLPESYVADALARGELFRIPLEEEIPPRSICLVLDTGRSLNMAARTLERALLAGRTILPEKEGSGAVPSPAS